VITSKIDSSPKRQRGRPAGFNREAAVHAAMLLFWERGYEGASFEELATAMGINASSFRNTFKTKEALYREATAAYVREMGTWFSDTLFNETNVRTAFFRLFEETATLYTRENRPLGCMMSAAALYVPPGHESLREMMSALRASAEQAMDERLKQGQRDAQIASEVDTQVLAAFFNTVFRGMAIQARDGASRTRLLEIAEVTMNAFPQ
jgi:AcrR family transcriptional regulator